jgi:hypothetical protein
VQSGVYLVGVTIGERRLYRKVLLSK